MRIYRQLDDVCGRESGCVLAVGNFDGLHLGHQEIFARSRELARAAGTPFAMLTFSEHTAARIRPGKEPPVIMTVDDRLDLAERLGVDAALMLPFDETFASLKPEQFVDQVLTGCLGVSAVVAGSGWRFGRERSGDMDLLAGLGGEHGFRVVAVPPVMVEGEPVSSTRIRMSLEAGNVELAQRLLGRPHCVRGRVVRGRGRGRDLGFPTVNLDCCNVILPARGVYAAAFEAGDIRGASAVNIGVRPTFGAGESALEAHLVGYSGDLYGVEVRISFLARLRREKQFDGVDELREAIGNDVAKAVKIYRHHRDQV